MQKPFYPEKCVCCGSRYLPRPICPKKVGAYQSLGTAAGTRVYLWSHSSRSLPLCRVHVQRPRYWSTGSPFQEAGNEYHLPFQEL